MEHEQQQIELSQEQATAINAAIEALNAQNALAEARAASHEQAAQLHAAAAQRERQSFQQLLGMHQTHILALVKQAGMKPEDFQNHGVVTEGGKSYLRANKP